MEKKKIESGAAVIGKTLSGRTIKGLLSYENFNPIITDKNGQKWLVLRQSVMREL